MRWTCLSRRFRAFCRDTRGTVTVEFVLALPLLFMALAATYEFFEVHRYKSVRDKASYTIADLLSREQGTVTETYMDNVKQLLDEVTNDDGVNQLRVSVIRYLAGEDVHEVSWSEVRGTGPMDALRDPDVADAHDDMPAMPDGEEVILVETRSTYDPLFDLGLFDEIPMQTRIFTSLRFAPQLSFGS